MDDSADIRRRLAEILTGIDGVEIVGEAESGVAGVSLVATCDPDLVVLDLHMPGGSGMTALKQLKALRSDLTVVVLTNYPYAAYRERCVQLGADYFFDKSTEFEAFARLVAAYSRASAVCSLKGPQ